jgi:hypothetical protein
MITTNNGTSTMGRTFFRYSRPAFNRFGLADEPDPRVALAVKELVALLDRGFIDKNNDAAEEGLKRQKSKLKRLEDETKNGIAYANEKLRNAIDALKKSSINVNEAEEAEHKAENDVKQAQNYVDMLIMKLPNPENKQDTDKSKKSLPEIKIDSEIVSDLEKAKKDLEKKQAQYEVVGLKLLQAKNDRETKEAQVDKSRVDLEEKEDEVKSDIRETIRYIKEITNELNDKKDYESNLDIYAIEKLPEGKDYTRFKIKIGSDTKLNSLFILIEDKIQKSSLSFNTTLFMKNDVLMEYLFLRTFFIDGLRDTDAIFDRMINEEEGGIKYLYDYIVKKVVTKIIKAKKLNND